jgi:serpin B
MLRSKLHKGWTVRNVSCVVLSLMCGCVGTRTGNPGNIDVPAGVEVARSELARVSDPSLSDADRARFGTDNRAFAFALYRELAAKPGNLFFSPYSISTALAMTYAGAKGDTAAEMKEALCFGLSPDTLHAAFNATDVALAKRKTEVPTGGDPGATQTGNGFELTVTNQAWGRKGYAFVDTYLDTLAQNYGAGLFLLDFDPPDSARVVINDWVAEQTRDRIKDLLPMGSIKDNTQLVLTNAIYFKASWLYKFDKSATKPAVFHGADSEGEVDTLHATMELNYAEIAGVQMVELPYISRNAAMLLVLPSAAEVTLDAEQFDALHAALGEHAVTLSLPKWSFESENPLKEPLQALGMEAAFDMSLADFTGMHTPRELYVDAVFHKAFVAVDEDGTEAAAATAVVIGDESEPQRVTVDFDRPFLFAVYDKPTGQVLFLGRVVQP